MKKQGLVKSQLFHVEAIVPTVGNCKMIHPINISDAHGGDTPINEKQAMQLFSDYYATKGISVETFSAVEISRVNCDRIN